MGDERFDNIARHPLLISEAMANRIDHACDASEAVQTPAGNVGDVGDSAKRYQVMRAHAVDGDAAHDYHVFSLIFKAFTQCIGGLDRIAAE